MEIIKTKVSRSNSEKPVKKRAAKSTYKKPKKSIGTLESGYVHSEGGVLIPVLSPVSASKLQTGIELAHDQINKTVKKLANLFDNELALSEIELTLGFDANGKFLGFGASAHINIKIKVKPLAS